MVAEGNAGQLLGEALAPVGPARADLWAGQPTGGGLRHLAHLCRHWLWFSVASGICERSRFCAHLHSHSDASALGTRRHCRTEGATHGVHFAV